MWPYVSTFKGPSSGQWYKKYKRILYTAVINLYNDQPIHN